MLATAEKYYLKIGVRTARQTIAARIRKLTQGKDYRKPCGRGGGQNTLCVAVPWIPASPPFRGIMFSGKPLDYQDEPLTNNGFWPDLNLKDFQAQRSLPADIDADTISQALLAAVAEVNAELENVEASWKAKGHTLAADVPGVKWAGLTACAPST